MKTKLFVVNLLVVLVLLVASVGCSSAPVQVVTQATSTAFVPSSTTTTPEFTPTPTSTTIALVSITVEPDSCNLGVGSINDFTATGTYSDGSSEDITSMVTWDSDAPNIMTIEPSGEGACVNVGVAQVTATYAGISSKAIQITVIPLSSIDVEPASPSDLTINSTQQFTATGTFSDGSTSDITSHVTWVSSNTKVATIDAWGKVTGVSAGSTQITATLSGIASSSISLSCVISSEAEADAAVRNYLTNLSLAGGENGQIVLGKILNNVCQEWVDDPGSGDADTPTDDWEVAFMFYVDPGVPEPLTDNIPIPLAVIEGTDTYVAWTYWFVSPLGIVTPGPLWASWLDEQLSGATQ